MDENTGSGQANQPEGNQNTDSVTPMTGQYTSPVSQQPELKKSKKPKVSKLFVLAAAGVLLMAGGVSAYFGVVVPNKPENVWKSALTNTARGYDRLEQFAIDQVNNRSAKGEFDFRVEASGIVVSGEGSMEYTDEAMKADAAMDIFGETIELGIISKADEAKKVPDLYVRVDGLDKVAGMSGQPQLSEPFARLNNKWYVVDSEQFAGEETEDILADPQGLIELQKAIGRVTKEYVLAEDENKSVLRMVEFVGKDTVDDRAVHHYKVGLHKENFKQYITAVEEEIKKSAYMKDVGDNDWNLDDLKNSIDQLKDEDTADVWIDSGTKLFRKVQITDKENDKNYLNIGLRYTGGDEVPFYLEFHGDEDGAQGTVKLDATIHTKENKLTVAADVDITGDQVMKITFNASHVTGDFDTDIQVPGQATPIEEIMTQLLGGAPSQPLFPTAQGIEQDFEL